MESILREDLNDIYRASALRELKVNLGLPWETIAQRLGLTKRRVLDLVGLLDLPEEIKEDIRQKKLTEKHGQALRQLLDKAEVLREVFNFLKEKKLTGDQPLELVRKIKSEPGFTIEESFNKTYSQNNKEKSFAKSPVDMIIATLKKLTNTIKKIDIKSLKKTNRDRDNLRGNLLTVKNKIENLLEKL